MFTFTVSEPFLDLMFCSLIHIFDLRKEKVDIVFIIPEVSVHSVCVWELLQPMAGINSLEIAMNDDF